MPLEPKSQSPLYEGWIAKAHEDNISCEILSKMDGPPSSICFHAQQVAEKYLKALRVYNQTPRRKTHDRLELESLLSINLRNIAAIDEALSLFNRYYIETRYPGGFPEFSRQEGLKAWKAAQLVKDYMNCPSSSPLIKGRVTEATYIMF
ncbi:MAG: HEPN domain-containing protein [Candidatus Omnitrophica bacterium]|nr:HEPN domain-containing protein [Candidatus Omnitrophota bacterium]